jgi:hypothetical protein
MTERLLRAPRGGAAVTAMAVFASLLLTAMPTRALEQGSGEQQAIDACEKKLCTMLLQKSPKGDDLKCQLTKTWARSTIKEAESKVVKWGFGDARCSVDLNLTRAAIVSAMTTEKFTYEVPTHTANCVVEQDGKVDTVTATLSPKIVFANGKAEKIWINLKNVEAPAGIKATIWTAARLEDSLGLFHRKIIKSTNKFIERNCAKKYPQVASAAGLPPPAKKKKDDKAAK